MPNLWQTGQSRKRGVMRKNRIFATTIAFFKGPPNDSSIARGR